MTTALDAWAEVIAAWHRLRATLARTRGWLLVGGYWSAPWACRFYVAPYSARAYGRDWLSDGDPSLVPAPPFT